MRDKVNCSGGIGSWPRRHSVALLLILLLATALRLVDLQDQSLWYDESDRVLIASMPLPRMFHTMADETVAFLPFYFLAVKPFTNPFLETTVRFPSVVFGVLAVAVMAQAGKELFGRNGGLMAALLLALNPFHIWFSREASFYVVVALSSTGALYFFARLLRRPSLRSWIGLTVMTGLGLWTHYFAFAIPLVEFVYLTFNLRRYHHLLRPWLVSMIVACLPLTPWYIFLLRLGGFHFGSAASVAAKPIELLYTFWNFSIGYTAEYSGLVIVSLLLFGGAALLGIRQIRQRGAMLPLLMYCFLPIVLAFLMSFRLPMYVDRYLIVSLPAFLLLVVAGVMRAPGSWKAIGFAGLLLASAFGAARIYYDEEYYSKEDWRGAASYIQSQERPGDAIMPLLIQSEVPFVGQYYRGDLPYEPILVQDVVRQPTDFADRYQRLWFVFPHWHDSTHLLAQCEAVEPGATIEQDEVRQWLQDHEANMVQRKDFACISVFLYDLTDASEKGP